MPMRISDKILAYIRQRKTVGSKEIAAHFKVSRQMANRYLQSLVRESLLVKTGSTRLARYSLPTKGQKPVVEVKLIKKVNKLQEDVVFSEILLRLQLQQHLPPNTLDILRYAFTEMLNNAIDHSHSKAVSINFTIKGNWIHFEVIDHGIGVFANIKKFFKLNDEWEAAEHLLKGKQTTFQSRHSGEGIFFTSKIADRFELHSHGIQLVLDNKVQDVALKEHRAFEGTHVGFTISVRTRKELKKLFDQYSDTQDYEFYKSGIKLGLNKFSELISRSQARRLLMGLDKFKLIVLDFEGVAGIGQAFADEIFRVFKSQHPSILIEQRNMNHAVGLMVSRVTGNK